MTENTIHPLWGTEVNISIEEFFSQDLNYWRKKAYDRKLLVFKSMKINKEQYVNFAKRFGTLWNLKDYQYSTEMSEAVETSSGISFISPFSNIINTKLGDNEMPWHADIPNRSFKPFPFRSLWITKNPSPEISGRTSWLNLELALNHLTEKQKSILDRITIIQQSWYVPGTDIQEFPLIKIHPVTGCRSLRLNYYNDTEKIREDAWITGVKIDGVLQKDCSLVEEFLSHLETVPELIYEHVWDTFDIVVYDNWSFVHKRTRVIPGINGERKFYRINIDHVLDEHWKAISKYI
jgi:alpha-ketoglutarate-dependent taurine dioxygenase